MLSSLIYLTVCQIPVKIFPDKLLTVQQGPKALTTFVGIASSDGYRTLLSPREQDPIEKNLFIMRLGPRLWGMDTLIEMVGSNHTFRLGEDKRCMDY